MEKYFVAKRGNTSDNVTVFGHNDVFCKAFGEPRTEPEAICPTPTSAITAEEAKAGLEKALEILQKTEDGNTESIESIIEFVRHIDPHDETTYLIGFYR